MDDHPHSLLPGRLQRFGDESCFLCGRHIPLNSPDRTVEHVFPKWLLRRLHLWDEGVTQLNGRRVAYRNITVPCCLKCNNVSLSRVEERIRSALDSGLNGIRALDRKDLFIWLGKIYYGLSYHQSLRPRRPDEQDGARLIPLELLQSIQFHHFLLQSVDDLVDWTNSSSGPASLRFYSCLESSDARFNFDYYDDLAVPMIALRMGPIGIVAVLQDWGKTESITSSHLTAAESISLHPTQFRETFGRIAYLAAETWEDREHLLIQNSGRVSILRPPERTVRESGAFSADTLSRILSNLWNVPQSAICKDGHVATTLVDSSGRAVSIPCAEDVFPSPFGETGLWPGHHLKISDGASG